VRFLGHVAENREDHEPGKEACNAVDSTRRQRIPIQRNLIAMLPERLVPYAAHLPLIRDKFASRLMYRMKCFSGVVRNFNTKYEYVTALMINGEMRGNHKDHEMVQQGATTTTSVLDVQCKYG